PAAHERVGARGVSTGCSRSEKPPQAPGGLGAKPPENRGGWAGIQNMKPGPFYYHAPSSLDEPLALLHDLRDDDAKVLAGWQSLMPILNMRLTHVDHRVDLHGVRELEF